MQPGTPVAAMSIASTSASSMAQNIQNMLPTTTGKQVLSFNSNHAIMLIYSVIYADETSRSKCGKPPPPPPKKKKKKKKPTTTKQKKTNKQTWTGECNTLVSAHITYRHLE